MAVDPRKFLLNTDYEMDKIIYFKNGSITASQYTDTFAHNLGFTPLIFGVCAFDSSFNDPRTIPFNYQTQQNTIFFNASANSSSITVNYNNYEDQNSKMYYRIYAFEPSNSAARVSPTSVHAKKFVLNTDYNYCKLCKKGIVNSDGSVAHNLGYVPQVLAWRESSGVITPIEESTPSDPITDQPQQVRVTTSEVTFQNIGKAHYRIYYDGA